jgi:hypothetical protein
MIYNERRHQEGQESASEQDERLQRKQTCPVQVKVAQTESYSQKGVFTALYVGSLGTFLALFQP